MFSFVLAGIMYLPFKDALCFELKNGVAVGNELYACLLQRNWI